MTPHCLDVPEILLTICEELVGDLQEGKKALVNLSLVNKRFQDTALNVLWKVQTSLIPLLKCFPGRTWEYTRGELIDGRVMQKLKFVRYLRHNDWQRVQLYACKIKLLYWTLDEAKDLSPDLWHILSASLPSTMRTLLPKLRELHYPDEDKAFYALSLLFSPSVRTFALSLHTSTPLRISCLLALPDTSPSLHTIIISGYTPGCLSGLGPALRKFKSLRNLVVNHGVTRKSMHWFSAHLQSLESLDLRFDIPGGRTFLQKPLKQGIFPKLKQATFRNIRLSLVPQLLKPIGSSTLSEINIHLINGANEEKWTQALIALLSFQNSLTTVQLHEHTPGMPYTLTRSSLGHLCALSRVECLHVCTKAELALGDDFLQILSASCRELRDLHIATNYGVRVPAMAPTLCGLLPLFEHCSKLAQLSLHIDATVTPFIAHPSTQFGVTNSSMHFFNVLYSPILDTVKVGTFLAAVTPNLVTISCLAAEHASLWKQTELHLQVARAVRS